MAYRKIEDSKLTAIANAIRSQLGTTQTLTLDEMPTMIANIGIGVIPSYWQGYLATKATEIDTALNTAGSNRSAFLWYTDAHWPTNYEKSPMLLRYMSNNTGMSKTFFGGDIALETSGETETLNNWKAMVKNIPNHRSIIGNHDNQVTDFANAAERAEYFLLFNRTGDMVTGTDATNGKMYYYVDDNVEKTRYICLSTGRMWTTEDEVPWCIDVLNSTPSGWHIVILSHLWLDYDNGGVNTTPNNYVQSYLDMFDAYNARKSGTTSLHSKAYNFTSAGAKIEFLIGGHIHVDYDFRTTGGIPVILTECDGSGERDATTSATKGTTTENCVYGVVADYAADSVKIINVGRGDTRTIQITESDEPDTPDTPVIPEGNYTNVLKTAKDTDGSIYNGIGYTTNTRLSGTTGAPTAANGWCTTGFIPCTRNDVLRFMNTEFFDMSGDGGSTSRTMICTYDSSFTKLSNMSWSLSSPPNDAWNAVYGDNGDIVQMSIPSSYDSDIAYVRITFGHLDEYSIITVNEEIGDSSGGTDEPDVPDVPVVPDVAGNLLPTAVGFDGAVLNANTTPGYAANMRYSTSSNKLSTLTGAHATGLIACPNDAVIRMRNISTDPSSEYYCVNIFNLNDTDGNGVYWTTKYPFSQILSDSAFKAVADENGTIIEFTLPGWQVNQTHIAICSQYIGSDSIITVNKVID